MGSSKIEQLGREVRGIRKEIDKLEAENAKLSDEVSRLRKVAEAAKSLNDNLEPEDISIDIESLVVSLRQYLKEAGFGDE